LFVILKVVSYVSSSVHNSHFVTQEAACVVTVDLTYLIISGNELGVTQKTVRGSVTYLFLITTIYLECILMGNILVESGKELYHIAHDMTDRSHVTTNLNDAHFNLIPTFAGCRVEV
jgi:hypothetical protein